jgi:hypothetical protein
MDYWEECVVCGEILDEKRNHHCDPKLLEAIESGKKERPERPYRTRLAFGFWMMQQSELGTER